MDIKSSQNYSFHECESFMENEMLLFQNKIILFDDDNVIIYNMDFNKISERKLCYPDTISFCSFDGSKECSNEEIFIGCDFKESYTSHDDIHILVYDTNLSYKRTLKMNFIIWDFCYDINKNNLIVIDDKPRNIIIADPLDGTSLKIIKCYFEFPLSITSVRNKLIVTEYDGSHYFDTADDNVVKLMKVKRTVRNENKDCLVYCDSCKYLFVIVDTDEDKCLKDTKKIFLEIRKLTHSNKLEETYRIPFFGFKWIHSVSLHKESNEFICFACYDEKEDTRNYIVKIKL